MNFTPIKLLISFDDNRIYISSLIQSYRKISILTVFDSSEQFFSLQFAGNPLNCNVLCIRYRNCHYTKNIICQWREISKQMVVYTRLARYGPRSFAVLRPVTWNSPPPDLHDTSVSAASFLSQLKTELFITWHHSTFVIVYYKRGRTLTVSHCTAASFLTWALTCNHSLP